MINLTNSQSEYLKAIYNISLKGEIKVTKIADYLNYSKPSVVRALNNLDELGLIKYQDKIKITEQGIKYAKNLIRRGDILYKFFIEVLDIEPELAKKDVEKLKNEVSCYTITKLENFVSEVLGEPIEDNKEYCLCDNDNNCETCIENNTNL